KVWLLIISLCLSLTIAGCAMSSETEELSSFDLLMNDVDLIAFVSLDKTQDHPSEDLYTLKIEEVVYSEGASSKESIKFYLDEGVIHDETSYLLFATKEDDYFYRANEHSLIIGQNDTY